MILEFSVTNFRSIKEKQTFSMLPEKSIKEHPEAILKNEKYQSLNCSILYGRNASGKSNIIKAFEAFTHLVVSSSEFKRETKIPFYQPYKLNKQSAKAPIEFKLDFIAKDSIRYIYEVSFTDNNILKEVLSFYPKKQIAKLFERIDENEISYGDYFVGRKKEIEELLYKNQLLLSKVGTEKIEALKEPYTFFESLIFIYSHYELFNDDLIAFYAKRMGEKKNEFFINNISQLLKVADTGISTIKVTENKFNASTFPDGMDEEQKNKIKEQYKYSIRTVRDIFENGNPAGKINFKLSEESTGTLKLLGIGGLIIEALEAGQTLIIDELDKSLHPKLTRALISIFMNKKTNPNNAQLIFATHDVSLLDLNLFRRDQIWFVEKEQAGNSSFYAVSDIEGVRNNIPLEKWYMSGRLGGTPVINQNELEFQF